MDVLVLSFVGQWEDHPDTKEIKNMQEQFREINPDEYSELTSSDDETETSESDENQDPLTKNKFALLQDD